MHEVEVAVLLEPPFDRCARGYAVDRLPVFALLQVGPAPVPFLEVRLEVAVLGVDNGKQFHERSAVDRAIGTNTELESEGVQGSEVELLLPSKAPTIQPVRDPESCLERPL